MFREKNEDTCIMCGGILLAFICLVVSATSIKVTVESVTVTNYPNEYFGEWSAEVLPGGGKISMKVPMLKELPLDLMVKFECSLAGADLPALVTTLCEVFKEPTIGKQMAEKGFPKGVFPTECPVMPGPSNEIVEYEVTSRGIPPGMPDGQFTTKVEIFQQGQESDVFVGLVTVGQMKNDFNFYGR